MTLQKMAKALLKNGMTQAGLAAKCGTTQPTISEIVNGKRTETSYSIGTRMRSLYEQMQAKAARK